MPPYFTKDFVDISLFTVLYKTFVRAKLEYACIAWSPYYAVHINSLEKNQIFPHKIHCERFSIERLNKSRRMFYILFLFKIFQKLYV